MTTCCNAEIVYTPRPTEFGRYDITGTRPCPQPATQTITGPRADGTARTSPFCDACADKHCRFTAWLDEQVRLAPARWTAPHPPEPDGTYLEIHHNIPLHQWDTGSERVDKFWVYSPGRTRLAHFHAPHDPNRDLHAAIASTGWELLEPPTPARGVHVARVRQIKPRPLPQSAPTATPAPERFRIRWPQDVIHDLADYTNPAA